MSQDTTTKQALGSERAQNVLIENCPDRIVCLAISNFAGNTGLRTVSPLGIGRFS